MTQSTNDFMTRTITDGADRKVEVTVSKEELSIDGVDVADIELFGAADRSGGYQMAGLNRTTLVEFIAGCNRLLAGRAGGPQSFGCYDGDARPITLRLDVDDDDRIVLDVPEAGVAVTLTTAALQAVRDACVEAAAMLAAGRPRAEAQ